MARAKGVQVTAGSLQASDDMLLEHVDLPIRVSRALTKGGLLTVGDVRDLNDVNLRCVRRIGNDSFRLLRTMFGPPRQPSRSPGELIGCAPSPDVSGS